MNGKDKTYLHFTPEAEVELELEPSRKEQIGYIILKNISPAGVGYKFRCSNKQNVTVDPATGVLGPAEEKQVTVSYLNWHADHSAHEKLQVLVAPLDDLYHADQNLHELFQRVATGDIQEHRIKVRPVSKKDLYTTDKVQDTRKEPKREPHYSVRISTAVQVPPEVKKELPDIRHYRPTDRPVNKTDPQATGYIQEPRPPASTQYDRGKQSPDIRTYPHGMAYASVQQRKPQTSYVATKRRPDQRLSYQVQPRQDVTAQSTTQGTYYHTECEPPPSVNLSTGAGARYRKHAISGPSSNRPETRYRADACCKRVSGPAEEMSQRSGIDDIKSWFRETVKDFTQIEGINDVETCDYSVRTGLFVLFVVALIVAIPLLIYSGQERHRKLHLMDDVSLFGESTMSATAAAVVELGGTMLQDRRDRTLDEFIHWMMN